MKKDANIKSEEKIKNNGINFCLGILAKNLEDIGITTAIEKKRKQVMKKKVLKHLKP